MKLLSIIFLSAFCQMAISAQSSSVEKLWVVSIKGTVTEGKKSELVNRGLEILRFIPDQSFLVRGPESAFRSLKSVSGYRELDRQKKISEEIVPLSLFSRDQSVGVVISGFTSQDLEKIMSEEEEINWLSVDGRVGVAVIHRQQLESLADRPQIEFVQEIPQFETMNFKVDFKADFELEEASRSVPGDYSDITGVETGTQLMNVSGMWSLGLTGSGQKVAVADTGFDTGVLANLHPGLFGAVSEGKAFGVGAKIWNDINGHGTHVAGSVAMREGPSQSKIVGPAYDSQIIAQGLWSPILNNLSVPPRLNTLFSHAVESGAFIHTNSWGNPAKLGAYDTFSQQVDEFQWNNPNFLILFAAGNSGCDADLDGRIDPGSVTAPGTAKNALTVGASEGTTTIGGIQRLVGELNPDTVKKCWRHPLLSGGKLSDNEKGIAVFSSRGPTLDGRIKPEIVAPGTNILSLQSQDPKAGKLWGAYNSLYAFAGGTSMATPLTAGAAALTRQFLIEKMGQKEPSSALIKATLMQTASDLSPGQYGTDPATQELSLRPNSDQGFGRVDLGKMTSRTLQVIDAKVGVGAGESLEYSIDSKPGDVVGLTLVYNDAPAAINSTKNLVNNIDVEVVQNGVVLARSESKVNNFETLQFQVGEGEVKLRVLGSSIPMGKNGKSPFAVVIER